MQFRVHKMMPGLLVLALSALSVGQTAPAPFAPLEQWKSAVTAGDAMGLRALYSSSPVAQITVAKSTLDADADVAFWTGLKAKKLKAEIVQSESPQPGSQQLVLQTEVLSAAASRPETVYVTMAQFWQQQSGQWRLLAEKRTNPAKLQQPLSVDKDIYHPGLDAHAEIKEALEKASKEHKRVILVFGANWCFDCHVLDLAFHRPDVGPTLEKNFEVIHIDVGEGDKNQDLMEQYQVPMKRGIPGVAVLESDGKLLYSQKNGEFEKARSLAPQDLLAFLNKWKPVAR